MSKNASVWAERLYETKAADLILHGRALGLSHAEAEDVLQETFVALMQKCETAKLQMFSQSQRAPEPFRSVRSGFRQLCQQQI